MQRVTLVRYTTKPESAAQNEKLSRAVFTELHEKKTKGVAYALLREGDQFLHVFMNMKETDSNVLTDLPSFQAFTKDSKERFAVAPEVTRFDMQLADSYGLPAA